MKNYEMFSLDQQDQDDLYEDMNNLYLKYFDRYVTRENHTIRVKGSVIIAIINTAEKLNTVLLKNEVDNLLKRLRDE
jgi:hypothetical protein